MIGNKIADKIKSVSKRKSTKELHNNDETDTEIKKKSPKKRQQIIDELRLVPKKDVIFTNYWWISVNVKKIHISQRKITNYW